MKLTTAAAAATIQFDLNHSVAPALVEIEKFGTGDVELAGAINNPVGLTRIYAASDDILSKFGVTARITTRQLDIEAVLGSIGFEVTDPPATQIRRIEVDLVQFIALKRPDGPSTDQLRTAVILAKAGKDVYLSLRGIDRVPTTRQAAFGVSPTLLTIAIDRIDAGRDIDLILRTAIHQEGGVALHGVRVLVPNDDPRTAPCTSRTSRRPDTASGSASHDPGGLSDRQPDRHEQPLRREPPVRAARADARPDPRPRRQPSRRSVSTVRASTRSSASRCRAHLHLRRVRRARPRRWPPHPRQGQRGRAPTRPASPPTAAAAHKISIEGFIDLPTPATGWLDVNVDGSVTLKEVAGDLRVGLVRSRTNDVYAHRRRRRILDADPADAAVERRRPAGRPGRHHHAAALAGSIGTEADFLETNLDDAHLDRRARSPRLARSASTCGRRPATCASPLVTAHQTGDPGTTDAALVAEQRLDPRRPDGRRRRRRDRAPHRPARRRRLDRHVDNDLEINSAINAASAGGRLYADAIARHRDHRDGERAAPCSARSPGRQRPADRSGHERRARSAADGCPPAADDQTRRTASPQDLILMPTGKKLVFQNDPQDTSATGPSRPRTASDNERSGIWAKIDISLWVGDDVLGPDGHRDRRRRARSTSTATRTRRGLRRHREPRPARDARRHNADADWGTTMTFAGRLGGVFDLDGLARRHREDADLRPRRPRPLHVRPHVPRRLDVRLRQPEHGRRRGRGRGSAAGRRRRGPLPRRPPGVDGGQADDSGDIGETLTLDGQDETDTYVIRTWGTQARRRATTSSTCSTPAPRTTASTCSTSGARQHAERLRAGRRPVRADDIFLLRRVTAIPGEAADAPGVRGAPARHARPGHRLRPERRRLDPAAAGRARSTTTPRSTAASSSSARAATTSSPSTTTARSPRSTAAPATTPSRSASSTARSATRLHRRRRRHHERRLATTQDVFATVATTRGWLSAGNSSPLVAGGDGRRHLHRLLEPGAAAARGRRRQRPVHRPRLRARADHRRDCAVDVNDADVRDRLARRAPTSRDAEAHQRLLDRRARPTSAPAAARTRSSTTSTPRSRSTAATASTRSSCSAPSSPTTSSSPTRRSTAPACRHLRERRGARDRRARGRRHVRRPLHAAGRRDARHRRPRQRRDQRRRRRRGRRRLARRRGHERHDQPRGLARPTRSTTASSRRRRRQRRARRPGPGHHRGDRRLHRRAEGGAGRHATSSTSRRSRPRHRLRDDLGDALAALRAARRRHDPRLRRRRRDYDRDVYVDGVRIHVPKRAIVLVFTPDGVGQDRPTRQTVSVFAVDDDAAEGDRVVVISHSVISDDAALRRRRRPQRRGHRPRRRPSRRSRSIEVDPGPATRTTRPSSSRARRRTDTQLTDAFDVRLAIAPTGPVTLAPDASEQPRRPRPATGLHARSPAATSCVLSTTTGRPDHGHRRRTTPSARIRTRRRSPSPVDNATSADGTTTRRRARVDALVDRRRHRRRRRDRERRHDARRRRHDGRRPRPWRQLPHPADAAADRRRSRSRCSPTARPTSPPAAGSPTRRSAASRALQQFTGDVAIAGASSRAPTTPRSATSATRASRPAS